VAVAQEETAATLPWWRGNLHTHTLWSDGDHFPEAVVAWYKEAGFHFLAITDHNTLNAGEKWMLVEDVEKRANAPASMDPRVRAAMKPVSAIGSYETRFGRPQVKTRENAEGKTEIRLTPFAEYGPLFEEPGRFLLLHGEEMTQKAVNGAQVHLGVMPLTAKIAPVAGPDARTLLGSAYRAIATAAKKESAPVFAATNHPNFRWSFTAEDLAAVPEAKFVEIWNGGEDDDDPGEAPRPSTEEIWDIANTLRLTAGNPPLFGLGTDDAHHYHGNKSVLRQGRAWVMVRAAELTAPALIAAMEAGDFYFSSGVNLRELRFDQASKTLTLAVDERPGETYRIRFIGTRKSPHREGKERPLGVLEPGEPGWTTLDYATPGVPPVGETLKTVVGSQGAYTLRGDELYVRAVIDSDAAPVVPSSETKIQQAWTQPVGWVISGGQTKALDKFPEKK
jgi:hypothetical protein